MLVQFVTLEERPDLLDAAASFPDDGVAEFLYQDATSTALFAALVARHPQFTVLGLAEDAERPVAMMCTMPFTGPGDDELPAGGYDAVLLSAAADTLAGRRGPMVSALFATVLPRLRGRGLSEALLRATLENTRRLGYPALVAPVRPVRKHEHPEVPMTEYVTWRRDDGLPVDPWLRVHARAGGQFVAVAPRSMTISGTLDDWRRWTGLPFAVSGPVLVPGGLLPVMCDTVHNVGTYIEPNAWIRHPVDTLVPVQTSDKG